ncbi:glycosyltransferase family 1 protein [Pseudomonas sp. SO81]|uniref:glycosyltransferase family 4 protein n=1 Tax=Pseudomonas sp. SO81 TaxID=2983246 RepID=UPI0025A417D9|nr:glycosyltransferase family 1 protein [Pseudomonas sp. SO81]WJN59457.1 Mannosyltransferase [Pseudomonas sp. SO81]
MSRLLFECTNVFRNPGVNSGIQRVVRNIVRQLEPASGTVECVPVLFAHNRLYRVAQLTPGSEGRTLPAKAYAWLERLNQAFWRLHGRYEGRWPMRRWHNARRVFFVLWRLLGLPLTVALRALRLLGYDPLQQRAEPFEAQPGDQLVLLDSSWHSQHFAQIEGLKRRGVGVIAVIYDLIPVVRPEFFEERLRSVFNMWFDWVVHQADGYMSISQSVSEQVRDEITQRLGGDAAAERWYGYFHLGSELDLRDEAGAPAAELVGLFESGRQVFLAVSTIEPRKNHAYLLDAFELAWAEGSQACLCIIGRVGWKCEALIKRIREHAEFGRRLFMFNDVDDNGLELAYSKAAALVFSSHAEGFGLPLVEAMQRGLPAMGSDLPVFREIGGEHMAYFSLDRPSDLAELVQRFESSGQFPADKALSGWRWIDWRESAAQLIEGVETGRVGHHARSA